MKINLNAESEKTSERPSTELPLPYFMLRTMIELLGTIGDPRAVNMVIYLTDRHIYSMVGD